MEITAMLNWLEKDLAAANVPAVRAKVPWIVIFGHKLRFTGGAELFDALENLNAHYDIDVYLGGHLHYYARYWPMCGNVALNESHGQTTSQYTDPGWITQIVSAACGSAEDLTPAVSHPSGVVSSTTQHYGLGILQAVNASHLHWQWSTELIDKYTTARERFGASDAPYSTFHDELWLVKTRHGPHATRACAANQSTETQQRHNYETCLVDTQGKIRQSTCSMEQTEKTLGEH
jgi:hypothetical protein